MGGVKGVHQGLPHLCQELLQKYSFDFQGGLEATAFSGCFPRGQSLLPQPAQRLGQLGFLF